LSTRNTVARQFVDALVRLGFPRVFGNLGTDHVAIIEELARREGAGEPIPEMILCPHETVAVHMAGAMAHLTGEGQAVLVHVDAGTANAAMGLHNLARQRLPVLLMAGRSPYELRGQLPGGRDNPIHWVQDPFDIGSLVRPYAKWEYDLRAGPVTEELLARAQDVMQSDPRGPVFLTLPREVLAAEAPEPWPDAPRHGPVAAGGCAPEVAARIAEALIAAENPVIVTAYLGRDADAVPALVALAEAAGIVVVEAGPHWLNFPRDHALHGGFEAAPHVKGCDLGLLLDVDVPWVPRFVQPNPQARWIQVDVDAIKRDFPLWGFPAGLRVQGACRDVLRQVLDAVRERADAGFAARVAARRARLEAAARERRARFAAAAAQPGAPGAITPAHLCAAIARHLGDADIVVNEAVRNTPAVLAQIPRTRPGTYMGIAGGGLGFSGGFALGARLARPGARVVQVVGDGAFQFMAADAVFATAQAYGLPFLCVVLDNGGWQAVKEAVVRAYPQGAAVAAEQYHARLQGQRRAFEQVGQAFGAQGERVEDPAALPGALERAFAALDRGQAAVLNVAVTKL
jgi:acetolactate synthase-1/2/3 large subunit